MTTLAWMDGRVLPLDQATVSLRSDCVMRGGSVFEGIPAYVARDDSMAVFRLPEHMQRLRRSMRVLRMSLPYPVEDLEQGILELLGSVRAASDMHLRPTVFFAESQGHGFLGDEFRVASFVTVAPLPVGDPEVRACVSTWRRLDDNAQPARVKSAANYLNSRLAHEEARRNGYGTAIMLDQAGSVAETPSACLMLVRDGVLLTPPVTSSILESITRATLLEVARDRLGVPVCERVIDRTELYYADEMLTCGSGNGIRAVVSVDGLEVADGKPGPITLELMATYDRIVRGEDSEYKHWLTPVSALGIAS